jgi:hypothetical protein
MLFALIAVLLITGCQQTHRSSNGPPEKALYDTVEKHLENSPSFKELKRRTKDWDFGADDATNGWVMVDLTYVCEDTNFIHRWASLEVQTNSGVILKEGESEDRELKWFPEFLPPTPHIDDDFPRYREKILEMRQRVAQWLSRERILKIVDVPRHWLSDDAFYGDTNFVAFYEHPVDCASNASLFLKSAENPDDAKLIVVYSLQRLPLQRYLEFESELIDMAESGQISSNLLNSAMFPGSEWSTKIQRNFPDQRVKDLLSKMAQCGEINPENKAYVKKIASGKAWADARELVEIGDLPADRDED